MAYPKPDDDKFYQKINSRFRQYEIPHKKRSFKSICYPKEYKLQIPQKFLGAYINPKTPYNGVLVVHKIGAGKTCTAINIAEKWKGKRKIFVVMPASLTGGFRAELRTPCPGNAYITEAERKKLRGLHPSSQEYRDIIHQTNKRINKYYNILSYNKFVQMYEDGDLNLRNSILLVDEIQNMISEDGKFYTTLYDAIHTAPSNLRVVLLSATPMYDKPVEIGLTMNLLRIPKPFPTGSEFDRIFIDIRKSRSGRYTYKAKNLDKFKQMIKGYVSYYRGAPPYVFPESTIKYVKAEMSRFQYQSYVTVLQNESKENQKMKSIRAFRAGEILELPNNFFIGARVISNIAFPNKSINEDGLDSLKPRHMDLDNLEEYSVKFYMIMKKINASRGPVFVYSNFKEFGGIRTLVKILEANGYSNYSKYGEGRRRFAVWSSDESGDKREEIKSVYNQPGNHNGSKIKVILGTPSMTTGVSLYRCRQIHILEPYWNYSKMMQIMGRGIRYCSHKDLPEEKRNVKVYVYIATHPDEEESVDEYIMKIALQKHKLITQFETALKEAAIDCTLFSYANSYKGEDPIVCEK